MRNFSKLLPASKMKLVISSIGVLILVAFSSLILYEATKADVTLSDNGEVQTIKTHADTVKELLEEVAITVGEHDALSHSLDAEIENGMEIEYKTAKQIIVTIDGEEKEYYTVSDTVGAFLAENNLSFSDRDDISHNKDEAITDGLHLAVNQAFQVTINDGGDEEKVWTTGGTIQELLDSNNISLSDQDKVEPAVKEDVKNDIKVNIVRVETKTEEVEEAIAFRTETREDNTLEKGKKKVLAKGQDGKIVKIYEVTFENGKEVSRELIDEEVSQDSENRVVAVGTKKPAQNLTTLSSGNKPSGGKEFTMTASAYTASCSGCSGYTTTGINLNDNPNMKVIAVDPSVIPLGSKVWVEGYGEAIAGDTGGHIQGNRIDVHVPTKSAAYSWGVRTVKVKIID
ncbi:ubiquitin-like domain-containing protein [Ornithinibacillus salinisoli]|uniref:Ubiquitin-like domain-containing protein n=1 Tax=Ornithinibacillus salinisoli TaxID=1848459 RepID=A0ABW4W5J4_9BACI